MTPVLQTLRPRPWACFVLGSLALAAPLPRANADPANPVSVPPPNFVFILADDLGHGDIGAHAAGRQRTPHLDRLAREGLRLTNFYSAPLCSASRAQLLTGCYAKRVSIQDVVFPARPTGLNPDEVTLPELLRARGYATFCVGKWHLGDQPEFLPTNHGFDHYFGLPYSNNMDGTGKPSDARNPMPPLPLLRDTTVIEAPARQETLTRRYTEEALRFIAENRERPFFLYLPHTAVHAPLNPGESFAGHSKNGAYGDWVEELDWSVGQVRDALQRAGLAERTVVLFTSDNGAPVKNGSNAPFRGHKGTTWEGGVHVPALVAWPGKIPAGSSSDALCGLMDVLPTFAKLAGAALPADRVIDGVDIGPVLSGRAAESAHDAIHLFLWGKLQALRSGPWKMVIADQEDVRAQSGAAKGERAKSAMAASLESPRLYDLVADPAEQNDIAARHPDVIERMRELVRRMDADLGVGRQGKERAPGVRPPGRVGKAVPLVLEAETHG